MNAKNESEVVQLAPETAPKRTPAHQENKKELLEDNAVTADNSSYTDQSRFDSHIEVFNNFLMKSRKDGAPLVDGGHMWVEAYEQSTGSRLAHDITSFDKIETKKDREKVTSWIKTKLKEEAKQKAKEKQKSDVERRKLERLIANPLADAPFQILGYDEGSFFFWTGETLQVQRLSSSDLLGKGVLTIAPLSFWLKGYQKLDAHGNISDEPNWLRIGDDLMRAASKYGVYESSGIRGRGYWKDSGEIIHHDGDKITYVKSGEAIPLVSSGLNYLYQRTPTRPKSTSLATSEEIGKLTDAIGDIYWTDNATASVLFFGWLVASPFCGMLPWNPHLWAIAPKGAGKSDTICKIASMVLPDAIYSKGATTEPGLRQELRQNAVPSIVDEMEPNDIKDCQRVDRIVATARNHSSDDEAKTLKGSATGASVSYNGRSMFMFTSINCRLVNSADASRFAVLGMQLKPKTEETKAVFNSIDTICSELDNADFGRKLEALTASQIDVFMANINLSITVVGDILGSARSGKQYGVLIGSALTHLLDEAATEDDIKDLVSKMNIRNTIADEIETSEDDGWSNCWANIAAIKLDFQNSNESVTVGEAIDWLETENTDEIIALGGSTKSNHDNTDNCLDMEYKEIGYKMIIKALSKYGIRYQHHADQFKGKTFHVKDSTKGIYVARKCVALSSKLKGSPYEDWTQYAKRASIGVTPIGMKLGGVLSRAEFIPSK